MTKINKMESTILLSGKDSPNQIVNKILSWNTDFSSEMLEKLGKFGWERKVENRRNYFLKAPSPWEIHISPSLKRFAYTTLKDLWNPTYDIYFNKIHVCNIQVQVLRFNTLYEIHWDEKALEQIQNQKEFSS